MDKMLAKQYYSRWQQVAEVERREQLAALPQQRWIQLNNLWQLAAELKLLPVADKTSVWERWTRLRKSL